MDDNGVLCDDIHATIAMCDALSDNHDVQCDASTTVMRRFQSDVGNVTIAMCNAMTVPCCLGPRLFLMVTCEKGGGGERKGSGIVSNLVPGRNTSGHETRSGIAYIARKLECQEADFVASLIKGNAIVTGYELEYAA